MSSPHDPFGERDESVHRRTLRVLGADIRFRSNDARLLRLAESAFAGLPRHRWRRAVRRLDIQLRVVTADSRKRRGEPSAPRLGAAAGSLIAIVDGANYALVDAARGAAVVQVSRDRLVFAQHVRYELIELAVFTLAARTQGLLPLHAACVGKHGRGFLVLGESGAGKSTFALASLSAGFELVAEDGVFVDVDEARATGAANFLHVRVDGLRYAGSARARVRRAPVIRRRSGVRKHQLDLRLQGARLAARPIQLAGVLVLSPRRARAGSELRPLGAKELVRMLRVTQPYATRHPRWRELERLLVRRGGHLALRGADPLQTSRAALGLLMRGASKRAGRPQWHAVP